MESCLHTSMDLRYVLSNDKCYNENYHKLKFDLVAE